MHINSSLMKFTRHSTVNGFDYSVSTFHRILPRISGIQSIILRHKLLYIYFPGLCIPKIIHEKWYSCGVVLKVNINGINCTIIISKESWPMDIKLPLTFILILLWKLPFIHNYRGI